MLSISSHNLDAAYILLLWSVTVVTLGQEEECILPPATVPFITFNGEQLPNHSYVDIELLGNTPDGSNVLQCHTDLSTCCDPNSGKAIIHTGHWVLPNGEIAGVPLFDYSVREGEQRIDLTFNGTNATAIEGIFRCDIPTNTDAIVSNNTKTSVYVGLYQRESHSELLYNVRQFLYRFFLHLQIY